MGTVSSNTGNEELSTLSNIPQNLRKMELKIDFKKDEHPALKQLLYCKITIYPIINSPNFFQFHKKNSIFRSYNS